MQKYSLKSKTMATEEGNQVTDQSASLGICFPFNISECSLCTLEMRTFRGLLLLCKEEHLFSFRLGMF